MGQQVYFIVYYLLLAYLALGALLSLLLNFYAINKIDASAKNSGILFRILLLPASCLLWPVLLVKWFRGGKDQ